MKTSRVITLAIGIAHTCPGDTLAGEPDKLGCERRESMLTAEGVAYDAPGGGKMGYLSPGTKYVAVTSLRIQMDRAGCSSPPRVVRTLAGSEKTK
jgi:hypothetical protein